MAKELNLGVTMSDAQELITQIVAMATANRWDFRVDFDSGGIDIGVRIPYDADGAPTPQKDLQAITYTEFDRIQDQLSQVDPRTENTPNV